MQNCHRWVTLSVMRTQRKRSFDVIGSFWCRLPQYIKQISLSFSLFSNNLSVSHHNKTRHQGKCRVNTTGGCLPLEDVEIKRNGKKFRRRGTFFVLFFVSEVSQNGRGLPLRWWSGRKVSRRGTPSRMVGVKTKQLRQNRCSVASLDLDWQPWPTSSFSRPAFTSAGQGDASIFKYIWKETVLRHSRNWRQKESTAKLRIRGHDKTHQ